MSARLDLAAVAAFVLEETEEGGYRVRPAARRMVTRKQRCPKRHLQAVTVATVAGTAVLWRPAVEARKARDVWEEAWADELPDTINVTCQCRRNDAFRWADCDKLVAT